MSDANALHDIDCCEHDDCCECPSPETTPGLDPLFDMKPVPLTERPDVVARLHRSTQLPRMEQYRPGRSA